MSSTTFTQTYHLTTGRTLAHYNNSAQTKQSESLNKRYDEDIFFVNEDDVESHRLLKSFILSCLII